MSNLIERTGLPVVVAAAATEVLVEVDLAQFDSLGAVQVIGRFAGATAAPLTVAGVMAGTVQLSGGAASLIGVPVTLQLSVSGGLVGVVGVLDVSGSKVQLKLTSIALVANIEARGRLEVFAA